MYAKIFESIYDGTLVEDWRALVTFEQMLILSDPDGILDVTAASISRRTGIPLKIINAGIDVLEKPDPNSRTPDEGGRRVVRLDQHRAWGWRIVNHKKYKGIRNAQDRREYMQEYMRDYRKNNQQNQEPCKQEELTEFTEVNSKQSLAELANTYTEADTDTEVVIYNVVDEFEKAWKLYPKRSGNNKKKANKCWNARIKEGVTAQQLLDGLQRYITYCTHTGKIGTEFVMHASTFFGPSDNWKDEWELPTKTSGKPTITDYRNQAKASLGGVDVE